MHEIFERQRQLNITTMKNIGVDYASVLNTPEARLTWIENYRKALSAELAELIREVQEHGLGTQNGKVEVIDILHFLVSLSQVVGIESSEIALSPSARTPGSFSDIALRAFLALDDVQNSLKWKWWAKGGGYKPEKARAAVVELWSCLEEICALFGLDRESVRAIYIEKNRVNFVRQEQAYNEDTKTEHDNLSIRL